MDDPALGDYAVGLVVLVVGATSLAVLFRLFQKHIDGRPLLPYEPRRRVPWNGLAPIIMLAPLASIWGALFLGEPPPDPEAELVAGVTSAVSSSAGVPRTASLGGAIVTSVMHEMSAA